MNTRVLLSIVVAPLVLIALVMAASSTGLSLAIYVLAATVCALTYATLYLQKDLEIQFLSEIEAVRDNLNQVGVELKEQQEQLVVFKREVLLLDARQSDRLTALEGELQRLLSKRHGFWQMAAPFATAVFLAFIAYSLFNGPHSVRAADTAASVRPSSVELPETRGPSVEATGSRCESSRTAVCI